MRPLEQSGWVNRWIGAAMLAVFAAGLTGCTTAPGSFVPVGGQPLNVLIVWCHPVKQTARQVDDPAAVRKLESFFPGYRQLGASPRSSGWLARYIIFINFDNGRSIRLVSDGQVWSAGRGDWNVAGDFEPFIEGLVNVRTPEVPPVGQ